MNTHRLVPVAMVATLLVSLAPAALAVPPTAKIAVDQQLEQMLESIEEEALEKHSGEKKRLRNVTIPLQGVIEDNILSANKKVTMSPPAILSAIEDELGKGSDKNAIASRLVRDQNAGRFYAK